MRGIGYQLRAHTSTCAGKVQFDSFDLASSVARRRSRNGKKNHAYRCGTCHAFHVGSTFGPSRLRRHEIEEDEAFA